MMQTSPLKSTNDFCVEVLRIDDGRVDVGEDLEFVRAADVVAVARRAVGDDLVPVDLAHLSRLERLDHPVLRRHAADPPVGFDGHRAHCTLAFIVFWTTMFGNFDEKSSAFCATTTATLRAIAAVDLRRRARRGRRPPSGWPESACSRMWMSSGSAPRNRHVVVLAHLLRAAVAEDVLGVAAVRADVDAHVLDDADDRHADLLEHLEALARVDQRDVLRRGDDHGAGDRHLLRQRQLDVAGARRHVDDQVVEIAPVRVLRAAARAPA